MQGSGAGSWRKGCCAGFWRVVNSVQCLKGQGYHMSSVDAESLNGERRRVACETPPSSNCQPLRKTCVCVYVSQYETDEADKSPMILGNADGNDGRIQILGLNGQTDMLIATDRNYGT